MKRFIALSLITLVALGGLAAHAADPSHLEGAATTSATIVNTLGRGYDVEGVMTKVRADTTTTNTLTISVSNTQDADLTGTNETQTAVVYDVKASGNYTGGFDWKADTTDQIRVPAGASLVLTFTGSCTNDYVVFRDDSDD
jgi:hypothetical protein